MEGFQERIKSLIATEGAAVLAARLGVSRAAIYLYAKGQTPSIGVVEKIGGTIQFPKTSGSIENTVSKVKSHVPKRDSYVPPRFREVKSSNG